MAGSAGWAPATNTLTFTWVFPTGAAALRAVEGLLASNGVDYSGLTTAQKVAQARVILGRKWKTEARDFEMLRDAGAAQETARQSVEANIDLS